MLVSSADSVSDVSEMNYCKLKACRIQGPKSNKTQRWVEALGIGMQNTQHVRKVWTILGRDFFMKCWTIKRCAISRWKKPIGSPGFFIHPDDSVKLRRWGKSKCWWLSCSWSKHCISRGVCPGCPSEYCNSVGLLQGLPIHPLQGCLFTLYELR